MQEIVSKNFFRIVNLLCFIGLGNLLSGIRKGDIGTFADKDDEYVFLNKF